MADSIIVGFLLREASAATPSREQISMKSRCVRSFLFIILMVAAVVTLASSKNAGKRVSPRNAPGPLLASGDPACTPPGVTVVVDAGTNDSTDGQANHDIISIAVSYPFTGDTVPDQLFFTIKVASLNTLTPNSIYFTSFTIDGAPEAAGNVHAVRMVVDSTGAAIFESYTAGAANSGAVDGRFVVAGSNKPAEAGSRFEA